MGDAQCPSCRPGGGLPALADPVDRPCDEPSSRSMTVQPPALGAGGCPFDRIALEESGWSVQASATAGRCEMPPPLTFVSEGVICLPVIGSPRSPDPTFE